MKKYKYLLFDLDGTITNSKEGITKCVQYALDKIGVNEPDLDKLEHFIGPPMVEHFMESYGFDKELSTKLLVYYRERYVPIGIYENEIYDGIIEMLDGLRKEGYVIALATSKPQEMAEEVLRYFDIYKYFDIIVGAFLSEKRTKKSEVIEEVLNQCHVADKSTVLMIGDRSYDVIGANSMGIDCMGVTYGFGSREELKNCGATLIVDSPADILNMLI